MRTIATRKNTNVTLGSRYEGDIKKLIPCEAFIKRHACKGDLFIHLASKKAVSLQSHANCSEPLFNFNSEGDRVWCRWSSMARYPLKIKDLELMPCPITGFLPSEYRRPRKIWKPGEIYPNHKALKAFPDKPRKKAKRGDCFVVVVDTYWWKQGEVIDLKYNDNSTMPTFYDHSPRSLFGDHYFEWEKLAPLPQ